MSILRKYLPARTYSIVCAYHGDDIDARVGGTEIGTDDSLSVFFPKPHAFRTGDAVTIHLDDRTGVEELSIEMRVYRGSYKGQVTATTADRIEVRPVQFQLYYGTYQMEEFTEPGYRFPADDRPEVPLPASPLPAPLLPDERERENNLGVWITRANGRPHTTVTAFLSSTEDDIFLISHIGTFKSACIRRDRRCCFAIDHRANYLFEKALDWNFSILRAEASVIPRNTELFTGVRAQFIQKNPWEEPFFTNPQMELIHLQPLGLVYGSADAAN